MKQKDYSYQWISGYKIFLLIFCFLLNVRLLTELPRMMREVGWAQNTMSDYDLNRSISLLLLFLCSVFIIIKRKIVMSNLLKQSIVLLLAFFFTSVLLAIYTFSKMNMPLIGIFVVFSRFIMELVLIIFTVNFVQNRGDLEIIFSYFLKPAMLFTFSIALIQILTTSYADIQGIFRITGPFGSPTTLAGFLHLFIALTFYYWKNGSAIFWVIITIEYVLLFFTGSVASIGANLVLLILIGNRHKWYKLKSFYVMVPIVMSVFISTVLYKWESILLRFSSLINIDTFQLTRGSSVKWRLDTWEYYLSLLDNSLFNWMFGLGMGTQRWIFHPEYANSLSAVWQAPGTHNDYLTVLIDFGIIGFILFIFYSIIVYGVIRRAERYDPKLYFLKYYYYTIFIIMLSENYIDQLIMFVFIVFLASIINVDTGSKVKGDLS